ncbi:MAG: hypothetical protein R3320_00550 [Nitriliruptorales bacterium]|nr:hypothetical protein [Nitriliruptorales bacterium]
MRRDRSVAKRVGTRRFVRDDGQVTCLRAGEMVDVGFCYLCNDAWEIKPGTGFQGGWVRCSFEPGTDGEAPPAA